jgi:adenosine kinase
LFTNEYEAELLIQKSGWTREEVLSRVGHWVITKGANGASVHGTGVETVDVGVAQPDRIADPTGVGDAFRSGYLAGLGWGLDDRGCAQLGNVMASFSLEVVGPQEYHFDRAEFLRRLVDTYGDEGSEAVAAITTNV